MSAFVGYKDKYDIFICGGSKHVAQLRKLLPRLYPYGRVHLGSSMLSDAEAQELSLDYDLLHRPRYHSDGYINFKLFCIKDLNRLARAPYFIKIDADVSLSTNWIEYVDSGISLNPEAALFGVKEGVARININLIGPKIRRQLGQEVRVTDERKVVGGFYIGKTAFFQKHDHLMQTLLNLVYRDQRQISEDTLRSMVVHATGASQRLLILDSRGRIDVPPCAGNRRLASGR